MHPLLTSLVLLLVCSVDWSTADIVGTDPADGSCLCPASGDLNIYETPCGDVITDVLAINECYRYTGNTTKCTLDIEYQFYLIDINGKFGWALGNFLLLEPSQYCAEFPCGAPDPSLFDSNGRIIGGSDVAYRDMYPWQLALEVDVDGVWELACGAALIDANWALTAAHCVDNIGKPIRVVAGVHNRSEDVQPDQIQNINENHITLYPYYNPLTIQNDLALLHISSGYDLSNVNIRAICLPPSSTTEYFESPSCYLTGWGITKANTTAMPEVLQRTGIDVLQPWNCAYILERGMLDSETCTYDQATRSITPCQGDMGGPLSCLVNTRFQLAAIGSFTYEDCNPRVPQIYTDVTYFLDWIKEVTGIE